MTVRAQHLYTCVFVSCVFFCALAARFNCRVVTVVTSRSSCVCSFRASFLLEQLAVLRVTLQLVALAFIHSPLYRKNAVACFCHTPVQPTANRDLLLTTFYSSNRQVSSSYRPVSIFSYKSLPLTAPTCPIFVPCAPSCCQRMANF